MYPVQWHLFEELQEERFVVRLIVTVPDQRVDSQCNRPSRTGQLHHGLDTSRDRRYAMLRGLPHGFGREAEGGDDIRQRRAGKQGGDAGALCAQFKPGVGPLFEPGQHGCREAGHGFQRETVSVITGEEPGLLTRAREGVHLLEEILVVDEENIIRRTVHALQKTVSAVEEAVQHVREIVIPLSTDTVTGRCFLYQALVLFREDQCRAFLLQPEILRLWIEDLAVSLAFDDRCPLVAHQDRPDARVLADFPLDIDIGDH